MDDDKLSTVAHTLGVIGSRPIPPRIVLARLFDETLILRMKRILVHPPIIYLDKFL